jgi:hypothetical protein
MARPLRIEYPGAFYHVTSRGNEQKAVYKSQRDREKFFSYLESATERYGAAVILGGEEFIAEIETRFLRDKQPDRDLPTLKDFSSRPGMGQIEKAVDSVLQSDKKLARQVKLHTCHRHSGMKLKEIGQRFGIRESGVTQASHRISMKAEKDKRLREIIKMIETNISLSNV